MTTQHKAWLVPPFLQHHTISGHKLLNHDVTADDTWDHHHAPQLKFASMQYKQPGFPQSKKSRTAKSASKLMATVYQDRQVVLFVDCMQQGTAINATAYHMTREELKAAVAQK
ncbi:hypothetical protein Cfor_09956 [Coptotermes formosanus]|jgi:hypothetical protein|uniref:Uncharacterized protein n=1 Tax=Coptotermes formosanus TaxID=36987 RepID=A0A6L2PBV6_COPFO|nr:hypothetical protein Cfor_09956 [Coptotermes formosanus]